MALSKFELSTLATMDGGRLKAAFDLAFQRLIEDCKDRPELPAARRVTLTVTVKPRTEQGSLDTVDVTFDIKDALPKRSTRSYNMSVGRAGALWNELSPDQIRQTTLDLAPRPRVAGKDVATDEKQEGVADAV